MGACVLWYLELIIELLAMVKYNNYTDLINIYVPVKSLSLKWILNKDKHQTMMKAICETQDHYPNQVLFQTENEPN